MAKNLSPLGFSLLRMKPFYVTYDAQIPKCTLQIGGCCMRLTSCALVLLPLAVTSAIAQKQPTDHQIDVPHDINMGVDLPHSTGAWTLGGTPRYKVYVPGNASPAWLQQRS